MNRAPLLPVADVQINPALPPFITLAKGKRERERARVRKRMGKWYYAWDEGN
jgi:hypothetical protein